MGWDISLVTIMKLTSKINLVLIVVVIITGLLIGVLCMESINHSFDRFLFDNYEMMLKEWGQIFVSFYTQNGGSWDGVAELRYFTRMESGVVLCDVNGVVLYHYNPSMIGTQITKEIVNRGYLLKADGQTIGVLYPAALFSDTFRNITNNFTHSTIVAVVKGIFFTSLFAIIVGLALSSYLVASVRELTYATRRMAKGHFEPLPIYSTDEIGDLSRAFNGMAREIQAGRKLRDQMIADVSHELRTPLTVLGSKLEFALEKGKPLQTEEVMVLYDEVIRLQGLVGELQDLSKLEAGAGIAEKVRIPMQEFFEGFLFLMEAEAEGRDLQLHLQIDDNLPYCCADPKRLKQIILNLVNNAFRYTPAGGDVWVTARKDNGQAVFIVRDNGIGIPEEELGRIFERFYRAEQSRNRENGGSGLGLAITKALVEAHKGTIHVESTVNGGTTFTVRLPDDCANETV